MSTIVIMAVLATSPVVEIHGNLVLNDQVYRAAINLPEDAVADEVTASEVAERALSFLVRSGYELVKVETQLHEGQIHLFVNEGQLSKVIFRGRGTVQTLRLRLELVLPHRVFNRAELERQLEELAQTRGIEGATYHLERTREMERHKGMQLDELRLVPGRPVRIGGEYELYINVPQAKDTGGARLSVGIESFLIKGGVGYRDSSLFFGDDKWDVETGIGVRLFRDVDDEENAISFGHAIIGGRYQTPSLLAHSWLRPTLELRAHTLRGFRADLMVDRYWLQRIDAGLELSHSLREGFEASLGGGVQYRYLFGVEQPELPRTGWRMEELSELWVFGSLSGTLVFDPMQIRIDRRHLLSSEVRYYAKNDRSFGTVDFDYQKVFEIGWNDLWLRGSGAVRFGELPAVDEEPMSSRFLRGVFGEDYFSDGIGAFGIDYRYSLSRDVVKVGVFHDLALFHESPTARRKPRLRVGNSVGLSFHALLLDFAQLDLFGAVGFVSDGSFDFGLSASLEKAF